MNTKRALTSGLSSKLRAEPITFSIDRDGPALPYYHKRLQRWAATLHLVYIDDSGDEKTRCFSALIVHESAWKQTMQTVRQHRRALKRSDGIMVTKELHATEFFAGRGHLGPRIVTKGRRCKIFRNTLDLLAGLPNVHLMNSIGSRAQERTIFERLVNRLNRCMAAWRSNAVIFHDEGKSYASLIRRMSVYPIRSKYGAWPDGNEYKNLPLNHILEDIIFANRRSQASFRWQISVLMPCFGVNFPYPQRSVTV